jgi:hypothetical protein
MWWYLIGLVWIALLIGIVWSYRRKKARLDAERAKQFSELYADLKLRRGDADAAPAPVAPAAAAPQPEKPSAPPEPPVSEYTRKPRLLGRAGGVLYLVFRTGLPDHEIFANLPLGDAVDIAESRPGFEREQKARRLAQLKIDLVVCTRQLEIVAAVMLNRYELDPADAQNDRFTEQCLRAAGIRVLRVDAKALPRHHQVRELVYGST